ncbi:MAG: type II toxin-antitoxin system HipA family toxin [Gammaproteobacteria bacterium]|nr:type II toxin-antitoxin system HipA family toxin [Gammaproteobacteria bacterium]
MVNRVETALIKLWGETVGAISWLDARAVGVFEFEPRFLNKGWDIAPLQMPIEQARGGDRIFSFPALNHDTFLGLPGLLADTLPDKFGNNIIDAWLARQGRDIASFSPVERLCYTGKRGMGALEFEPANMDRFDQSVPVEISALVSLAQKVMEERLHLETNIGKAESPSSDAILDILRVGTSAGGARPKAVIAMNAAGNIVSGQTRAPEGYEHWILKFDGVTDLELGKPMEFGRIEYAYYKMACAAGIHMSESRLLEEGGRAHFLTKRFDRTGGEKIHLQSLCGIAHYDYNQAGAYSYEQAFMIMRRLRLSKADAIQQFRRMVFNVVTRNQDDHTKNIAFLMNRQGKWSLSPAFDITYSHNPAGKWTQQHQMTINGKRDAFKMEDLITVGDAISLPKPREIVDEIIDCVSRWPEFASQAGISDSVQQQISQNLRIQLA